MEQADVTLVVEEKTAQHRLDVDGDIDVDVLMLILICWLLISTTEFPNAVAQCFSFLQKVDSKIFIES